MGKLIFGCDYRPLAIFSISRMMCLSCNFHAFSLWIAGPVPAAWPIFCDLRTSFARFQRLYDFAGRVLKLMRRGRRDIPAGAQHGLCTARKVISDSGDPPRPFPYTISDQKGPELSKADLSILSGG